MWQPRRINNSGDPKYGAALVFRPDADLASLKAEAKRVAELRFGNRLQDPKFRARFKLPFKDGSENAQYEGFNAGEPFIRVTSKYPPKIYNARREEILDQAEIYPGCFVKALVNAFAYENSGNVGVSFGFSAIQKVGDGKPLAGSVDPSVFEIEEEQGGEMPATAAPAASSGDSLFD